MDNSKDKSDNESVNYENRVVQEIMSCTAIVACNALVDNNTMAGVWRISNLRNDKIVEDYIYYKYWELCGVVAAEALTL